MWTTKYAGKQWLEDFEAIITDKRITKQGLHIKFWFGDEIKEGDILEIL